MITFTPTKEQILKWRDEQPRCHCPISQAIAAALNLPDDTFVNAGPLTGTVRAIKYLGTGTPIAYVPATDDDLVNALEFMDYVDSDTIPVEMIPLPTLTYKPAMF